MKNKKTLIIMNLILVFISLCSFSVLVNGAGTTSQNGFITLDCSGFNAKEFGIQMACAGVPSAATACKVYGFCQQLASLKKQGLTADGAVGLMSSAGLDTGGLNSAMQVLGIYNDVQKILNVGGITPQAAFAKVIVEKVTDQAIETAKTEAFKTVTSGLSDDAGTAAKLALDNCVDINKKGLLKDGSNVQYQISKEGNIQLKEGSEITTADGKVLTEQEAPILGISQEEFKKKFPDSTIDFKDLKVGKNNELIFGKDSSFSIKGKDVKSTVEMKDLPEGSSIFLGKNGEVINFKSKGINDKSIVNFNGRKFEFEKDNKGDFNYKKTDKGEEITGVGFKSIDLGNGQTIAGAVGKFNLNTDKDGKLTNASFTTGKDGGSLIFGEEKLEKIDPNVNVILKDGKITLLSAEGKDKTFVYNDKTIGLFGKNAVNINSDIVTGKDFSYDGVKVLNGQGKISNDGFSLQKGSGERNGVKVSDYVGDVLFANSDADLSSYPGNYIQEKNGLNIVSGEKSSVKAEIIKDNLYFKEVIDKQDNLAFTLSNKDGISIESREKIGLVPAISQFSDNKMGETIIENGRLSFGITNGEINLFLTGTSENLGKQSCAFELIQTQSLGKNTGSNLKMDSYNQFAISGVKYPTFFPLSSPFSNLAGVSNEIAKNKLQTWEQFTEKWKDTGITFERIKEEIIPPESIMLMDTWLTKNPEEAGKLKVMGIYNDPNSPAYRGAYALNDINKVIIIGQGVMDPYSSIYKDLTVDERRELDPSSIITHEYTHLQYYTSETAKLNDLLKTEKDPKRIKKLEEILNLRKDIGQMLGKAAVQKDLTSKDVTELNNKISETIKKIDSNLKDLNINTPSSEIRKEIEMRTDKMKNSKEFQDLLKKMNYFTLEEIKNPTDLYSKMLPFNLKDEERSEYINILRDYGIPTNYALMSASSKNGVNDYVEFCTNIAEIGGPILKGYLSSTNKEKATAWKTNIKILCEYEIMNPVRCHDLLPSDF